MTVSILMRKRVLVVTDPQRRVYNGVPFSSEEQWSSWGLLESGIASDHAEQRLHFWRDLNDYAVKQGRERCEYKSEAAK